jgi:hypothetical protein
VIRAETNFLPVDQLACKGKGPEPLFSQFVASSQQIPLKIFPNRCLNFPIGSWDETKASQAYCKLILTADNALQRLVQGATGR